MDTSKSKCVVCEGVCSSECACASPFCDKKVHVRCALKHRCENSISYWKGLPEICVDIDTTPEEFWHVFCSAFTGRVLSDKNLCLEIDLTGFNFLDQRSCYYDENDRMMLEDLGNPEVAVSNQNFSNSKEFFQKTLENFVASNHVQNQTVYALIEKKCEERLTKFNGVQKFTNSQ